MTNWNQLITDFHRIDHSDTPKSLILGQPASEAAIEELEESSGFALPPEFHELYSQFDGFGDRSSGEVEWFFHPVAGILPFSREANSTFEETHGELSKRFLAFIDWGCGDYMGYLFSPEGKILDGLFIFEHEAYEFEAGQDPGDFLPYQDASIAEFLKM